MPGRLRLCGSKNYLLFFFNDTATTEIYTLSLHDALPIWVRSATPGVSLSMPKIKEVMAKTLRWARDRKSTRLNSSHSQISYAVFCLKKTQFGRFWQNRGADGIARRNQLLIYYLCASAGCP